MTVTEEPSTGSGSGSGESPDPDAQLTEKDFFEKYLKDVASNIDIRTLGAVGLDQGAPASGDLVSKTFERFFRARRSSVQPGNKPLRNQRAYLMTCAGNVAIDHLRSLEKKRKRGFVSFDDSNLSKPLDRLCGEDPVLLVEREEIRKVYIQALTDLETEYPEPFGEDFAEGMWMRLMVVVKDCYKDDTIAGLAKAHGFDQAKSRSLHRKALKWLRDNRGPMLRELWEEQ